MRARFWRNFAKKMSKATCQKMKSARNFVEHFYARYEAIGNDVDDSGEWQRWQS
ncbi:hypothetical protein VB002_05430 [Campylobacter concisus]